jgi:EmrB/QacA subfamily drug resistance transporter
MNADAPALDPDRWKGLAVIGASYLMTILDISIVNVALPTIGVHLHFSQENLQWVITAYAITFGGFLLLGGRAADLLGRRSVFMVGVALFTGASLACGLAGSESFLIAMRALQGIGGAIVAPAGLSIVSAAFPEGAERNKALGVWGALAGCGGAIGVVLGGVLTKYAGWEWIFFVNVPIGVLAIALCPRFVRESKLDVAKRRYDPLGAFAVTASIVLIVYAISKAPSSGWASGSTIGLIVASVVLMAAFIGIEARGSEPLMPLAIWRLRTVVTANVVGLLTGAAMFSTFFLFTLYTQNVLHYSPLQTGISLLSVAFSSIVASGFAQALTTRIGPKAVLTAGMAIMGGALIYFAQIPTNGSYVRDLLGPLLILGVGAGFAFVPISIIALTGVPVRMSGVASGLMNTTQQVGGAVGLAVVATLFTTRFTHLVAHGTAAPAAMVSGFGLGFWVLGICALVGSALTAVLLGGVHVGIGAEHQPDVTQVTSPFCMNHAATAHVPALVLGGADAPAPAQAPTA